MERWIMVVFTPGERKVLCGLCEGSKDYAIGIVMKWIAANYSISMFGLSTTGDVAMLYRSSSANIPRGEWPIAAVLPEVVDFKAADADLLCTITVKLAENGHFEFSFHRSFNRAKEHLASLLSSVDGLTEVGGNTRQITMKAGDSAVVGYVIGIPESILRRKNELPSIPPLN